MYKYKKRHISRLTSIEKLTGEPIEWKVERLISNQEPISDGAPAIYTARKDGVQSAYNIRTDRWEVATMGMDTVQKSIQAKRDNKAKSKSGDSDEKKGKIVKMEVSGAETTEGTGTK